MQNFNKPWPCGSKWHEELGELSLEHTKVWKIVLWWALFVQNISARKFHRNYVSWHWKVMQNWKKNWLVAWKMTKGISLIFMPTVEYLTICTLMGCFCPKHISTKELCFMTLKSDEDFEEKRTLGSKNDMRNLVNFNASSGKSANLYFDVLLLSIP